MRKIISFMHISLDGFVAGPKGEMDWIKVDQDIFDHVALRISKGDTALYGRNTYEMMEGYWPTAGEKPDASKHDIEHSKWYKGIRKIVLSETMKNSGRPDLTIIGHDLKEKIDALKDEDGEDILVFGSPTATHSLMKLDLLDGYWLFVNPIVLGKGIPLFKDVQHLTELQLQSTQRFSCGVTELSYLVNRK